MSTPTPTKEPIIEAEESTLEEIYSTEPQPMKRRAGRELPEPTFFKSREDVALTKDTSGKNTATNDALTTDTPTEDAPTKDTPENTKSKPPGLGKRLLLVAKRKLRLGSLSTSEEKKKSDGVAEGS